MTEIVVEYAHVDVTDLAHTLKDLEKSGYQVWLDLAVEPTDATVRAVERHYGEKAGLYSIYAEDPVDPADMVSAIQQFGEKTNQAGAIDEEARVLFACLKGTPSLPGSFRRLRSTDFMIAGRLDGDAAVQEAPSAGEKVRPAALISLNAGERDTGPSPALAVKAGQRDLIFQRVMRERGIAARHRPDEAALAPAPLKVGLSPSEVDHISSVFRPQGSVVEPVVSAAAPAPRSLTAPATNYAPKIPAPSYTANDEDPDVAVSITPTPERSARAKRLDMVHTLCGLTLATTVMTFLAAVFVFARADRDPFNVAAIAVIIAMAPFLVHRLLRRYEHKLRAAERRSQAGSPITV